MSLQRVRRALHGLVMLYTLIALSVATFVLSIYLLLASLGYMERGFVGTSLLSALIGFTFLSASLYLMRLATHVYAVQRAQS